MPKKISFMGVHFTLSNKEEVLNAIEKATVKDPVRLSTPNPEHILDAQQNSEFKTALASMTHTLIDGTGLSIALTLFSPYKAEVCHGSDLLNELLARYKNGEKTFYFVGDKPGVAAKAAEVIRQKYPHIKIVGAEDGGRVEKSHINIDSHLASRLTKAAPDILVVGYGAPKQELWIQAAHTLPIPVMLALGGSAGFYGSKRRAPLFIQRLHLEWIYRAITEKGHWKRSCRAFFIFAPYSFLWWICTPFHRKAQ